MHTTVNKGLTSNILLKKLNQFSPNKELIMMLIK